MAAGKAGPRFSPGQLAGLLGLDRPTAEQAAVIGAPLAPMAVVAGAGSGKSETMAARLVWLVAHGYVTPERVLGLTFTRKAAAELAARVRSRLEALDKAGLMPGPPDPAPSGPAGDGGGDGGDDDDDDGGGGGGSSGDGDGDGGGPDPAGAAGRGLPGEPVIATYNSYAARLITDYALREALEPTMRLVTPAVAWQLAARVVAAYDGPMDAVDVGPAAVTAAVLSLSGEISEHLRRTADVRAAGEVLAAKIAEIPPGKRTQAMKVLAVQRTREQLLPLVEAYARLKAEREVIDYGDQMALAARIAIAHPRVGAIERASYQVVLLDEFQDTSHAQLELMRALFGGGHPVTAVGDPCQSIYGWRGASAGNLSRFTINFPPTEAGVPARSTGHEDGPERRGDRDGSPAEGSCAAAGPEGTQRRAEVRLLSTSFRNTGRVLDVAATIQAELRAEAPDVPRLIAPPERAARGAVVCALLETAAAEAGWVAGQIAGLLALPPGVAPDGGPWPEADPDGDQRQVRPADIAVLCRKRAQFAPLRTVLEARGIPVEVVGLGGLLTVPEVADIVATLRVLHSPDASNALARLLTSPRWRIGPRDLVALGNRARELASGAARAAETPDAPESADPLSEAVADFTRETGSLVEALDDLGQPEAYSEPGYQRMTELAAELRLLRRQTGRPLAELVIETERALNLDVEVAARPGTDALSARADLDAFADAAAAFAGDAAEPTLGAFLAYLAAAEHEEFGLEAGRVSAADSVKLATVHSAKGLQWAAVVVPGLAAGTRARVFPAASRESTRWTDNPRLLPFWLRGDAADLPRLASLEAAELKRFEQQCKDRDLAEERRLAYVAMTRSQYWLACSGYWWGSGKQPLGPSVFLGEVRQACEAGAGTVARWADEPEAGAENPALAMPLTATWPPPESGPATPAGRRLRAARDAAAMVRDAMTTVRAAPAAGTPPGRGAAVPGRGAAVPGGAAVPDPGGASSGLDVAAAGRIADWVADADLLLAERAKRRHDGPVPVELPRQLAVSALVTIADDPDRLAAEVRRPMPRPPAPRARRGTEFHAWITERFGQQRLIDPDDLTWAEDEEQAEAEADADLAELKARFETGEWAHRVPVEVELPFETRVGDRLIRGRIDAVFADAPDGRYDVVDWKTGRPPAAGPRASAAAVQLAAYRLAWAALAGVSPEMVRAAFYYVRQDLTFRPADLLDADGLASLIAGVPAGPGA